MKLILAILLVATVLGSVVSLPHTQINYSYQQGPNTVTTSWNSECRVLFQSINSNSNTESFPSQWIAEFINPVNRKYFYVFDNYLALMNDRRLWTLKPFFPNSSRILNAWNVEIQLPEMWMMNHNVGHFTETDGAVFAIFYLSSVTLGIDIIQSRVNDNESSITPDLLEVDPTIPVSMTYVNKKLVLLFSVRREQSQVRYPYYNSRLD